MKVLLAHNANPNQARNGDGTTPMIMAAWRGHVECLKMLLEHDADPNQATNIAGATPAWMAAMKGHVECLKVLLEYNTDPNQSTVDDGTTLLHASALNGHCTDTLMLHNSWWFTVQTFLQLIFLVTHPPSVQLKAATNSLPTG